jgi:sugar-specific transcriptional regulator TrmB
MNKFITLFERIGIGEKTARIYLDLLAHGDASIAEICKRTSLHRPEVYRFLPFLTEERLIEEILHGKRTLYRALSPIRIEEMIHEFEKRNAPLVSELRDKYEKL